MVSDQAAQPRRRCPICGKAAHPQTHPFCSHRCATIDLGRWFSGAYALPSSEEEKETAPEAEQKQGQEERGRLDRPDPLR